MDGPNPSEMDIKVFTPAPKYCLQAEKVCSINWKTLNISLVGKDRKKCKMQNAWLKYENNTIEIKNDTKKMTITLELTSLSFIAVCECLLF